MPCGSSFYPSSSYSSFAIDLLTDLLTYLLPLAIRFFRPDAYLVRDIFTRSSGPWPVAANVLFVSVCFCRTSVSMSVCIRFILIHHPKRQAQHEGQTHEGGRTDRTQRTTQATRDGEGGGRSKDLNMTGAAAGDRAGLDHHPRRREEHYKLSPFPLSLLYNVGPTRWASVPSATAPRPRPRPRPRQSCRTGPRRGGSATGGTWEGGVGECE